MVNQMILQNIIFPHYGICSEFDLYFRLSNNYNYSYQNNFVFLNAGGWAHFDTYFNGFMKNKWLKYTYINNLQLNLEVKGTLRISILNKERERNGTVTNRCIDEIEVVCPERELITVPVRQFDSNGMYTFSIYAISDNCYLYGGYYSSIVDEDKRRTVNMGVCICTYKREKYVKNNIQNIKNMIINTENIYRNALHIFISDNANSLGNIMSSDEHVHVYPNKNVGGAGGFTRCLIEVLNNPQLNITHALFMDDDIVIEPEALFRTFSFLSVVREEYSNLFIGGSMMRLDSQTIQTESGAVWNKGMLQSLKHNLDLRSCESCLYNDIEETCDYNAWWYCVTPMEYVTPTNLPMPLFIRGDDVEYGLRNTENIVQLNGICVWHEPFENKYSSMMYYYILRNRFIDNAVRDIDYSVNQAIIDYTEQWRNEILLCRYRNAHLLSRGVNDFLEGVEWLKRTDAEELNKSIMSEGYKLLPANELDFTWTYADYLESVNYSYPNDSLFTRAKIRFDLIKHDKEVVMPTFDPVPRRCADAKTILNYDYSSGKGFVTNYSRECRDTERKYYKETIKRMKKDYARVVEEYRKRKSEFATIEFWNSYLGIQ